MLLKMEVSLQRLNWVISIKALGSEHTEVEILVEHLSTLWIDFEITASYGDSIEDIQLRALGHFENCLFLLI